MARRLDWTKADEYEEDPARFCLPDKQVYPHGLQYKGPPVAPIVKRTYKLSSKPTKKRKAIRATHSWGSQYHEFVENRRGAKMIVDFGGDILPRIFVTRHQLIKQGCPMKWLREAENLKFSSLEQKIIYFSFRVPFKTKRFHISGQFKGGVFRKAL